MIAMSVFNTLKYKGEQRISAAVFFLNTNEKVVLCVCLFVKVKEGSS